MKRLWFKIFFVLISANIALAFLLYWGFNWSFELAFKRYLREQEQERFQPFVTALIDEYQASGGWHWVKEDHRRWQALMREYIIDDDPAGGAQNLPPRPGVGRPSPSDAGPQNRPPGANAPVRPNLNVQSSNGINPHILLFDRFGNAVIGNVLNPAEVYRFDIEFAGEVIGGIGVRAQSTLYTAMQAVISNQKNDRLWLISLGLLLISSLIAFWLATWLTMRIYRIKVGTTALVRGQYDHRIELQSKDALGKLASDFNGLAETLEHNRDAHRRWIANTSHELRTPVTILLGEIDALKDGIRQVSPEYLDSLSGDVVRLNSLIDDLHQLSMSDIGALNYQKDEIHFVEFVDDELVKLSGLLPEGLTLNWQKPEQDYQIIGDYNRLAQLMENLLQNSIRYTDTPGRIDVAVQLEDKKVMFVWQDSSPSVKPEDFKKLIQPLFRVEDSRSRKVAGSGLGLAIVNSIVMAHGATLTAEHSSLGGLKWQVEFPRVKGTHR